MKREIKFRGRRSDGKWLYGDLIHNRGRVYIADDNIIDGKDICGHTDFEVDEHTVGQFTGLQDTDGKDIYEGDVLSVMGCFGGYFGYVGFKYGAYCTLGIEPDEWGNEHSIDDILDLDDVDLRPFTSPICMTEMRSMKMNPCDECAEILGNVHDTERFAHLPERYQSLSEIARAMEEADMINFDFAQSLKDEDKKE